MKEKLLNIRIEKPLLDAFTKRCTELGTTKTEAVTNFIVFYIAHQQKVEE